MVDIVHNMCKLRDTSAARVYLYQVPLRPERCSQLIFISESKLPYVSGQSGIVFLKLETGFLNVKTCCTVEHRPRRRGVKLNHMPVK